MTANLTVPADVWACQQPGVPLVAAIVEGEIMASSAPMFPDSNLPGTSSIPPAWLVALRDARCETCGGAGWVEAAGHHPGCEGVYCEQMCPIQVQDHCPNPRCVSGWLLHDVRVECDASCDDGTFPWKPWDAAPEGTRTPCAACNSNGYRTVRCLVDVVKVRRDYTDHGSPAVVVMCEPMVSAGRVFWVAADGSSSVALTPAHVDALAESIGITEPADWPGCWAVVLTEEAE